MSNRTVVYKRCRRHSQYRNADPQQLEDNCEDCRRAGFRATMAARGITLTVPHYRGGYPRSYVDEGSGWPEAKGGQPTFADVP